MMSAQDRLQRVVSNDVTKSRVSIEIINDVYATITGRIVIGRVVWPQKKREGMSITKHTVIAYKPGHHLNPGHTIDASSIPPWPRLQMIQAD